MDCPGHKDVQPAGYITKASNAMLVHCQPALLPRRICKAMPPCCAALQVFVELGLITAAEMEEAIVSEFNPVRWELMSCCRAEGCLQHPSRHRPGCSRLCRSAASVCRVALHGSPAIVTTDVLNCGVYPVRLLESVKQRFLGAGG